MKPTQDSIDKLKATIQSGKVADASGKLQPLAPEKLEQLKQKLSEITGIKPDMRLPEVQAAQLQNLEKQHTPGGLGREDFKKMSAEAAQMTTPEAVALKGGKVTNIYNQGMKADELAKRAATLGGAASDVGEGVLDKMKRLGAAVGKIPTKAMGKTILKSTGKLAGGVLPIAGIATAIATQDASAALPDWMQAEDVGKGSDIVPRPSDEEIKARRRQKMGQMLAPSQDLKQPMKDLIFNPQAMPMAPEGTKIPSMAAQTASRMPLSHVATPEEEQAYKSQMGMPVSPDDPRGAATLRQRMQDAISPTSLGLTDAEKQKLADENRVRRPLPQFDPE